MARTIDIVPAMKTAGFDWLVIDLEHGALSIDTASQISIAALHAKITPIARVPSGDSNMATRLLDNGALGLVMPHVDTTDEAKNVVQRLRFPPQGQRSVFGGMPHFDFDSTPVGTASEILNRETLLVVMLETPAAIVNAPAIAAVDGIDILLIGTNDLCSQMGIPGNFSHPSVGLAYQRTIAACRTHGKWAGMGGVYNVEIMSEFIGAGVQFVLGGSDLSFMISSASQKAKQLRQAAR